MIWDTGVAMIVKGTFHSRYIPYPPNSIGSTEENGKTHTKIEKFVIRTPQQALIKGFDLGGVG